MDLILFTTSFPYDFTAEYAFLSPEIRRLSRVFKKITLVPRVSRGERLSFPDGVEVNDTYAQGLRGNARPDKTLKAAFASACFSQEIRAHPSVMLYPSKILKLILFSSRAEFTRQWSKTLIETQGLDVNQCLFYSYWFDHTPTGIALLKQKFTDIKLVTRAHGYDIYEKYYYPYYWPYRRETLSVLKAVFVASDAGRQHFCEQYPEYCSKFETAHLGMEASGFIAKASRDGVFRIVTCSYIVPVKRLNLLLQGIAAAARLRPAQKFEWLHFGDGQGRKALERRVAQRLPANVRSRFRGHVANREVLKHYKEQPVDVFVNVSRTEGGAPVSIQEAISCGIPVIATAVGGNPEIVSDQNGILLSPDPKPDEIAAALLKLWDDPSLAARLRTGARQVWQTGYNAEVNFRAFAERLQSIGASS